MTTFLKNIEQYIAEATGMKDNRQVILTKSDLVDASIWDSILEQAGWTRMRDNEDDDFEVLVSPSRSGVALRREDFTQHALDLGIWDSLSPTGDDEVRVAVIVNRTKEQWYLTNHREPRLLDN